jgi:hypothetical protein
MSKNIVNKKGVPVISAHAIELKAEEVISYFDKKILCKPQPTPLIEFVKILNERFNLLLDFKKDLGTNKLGKKILGITQLKPLGIRVAPFLLMDDPRFSFVLGHELGHVVFHRNIDLKRTGYESQEIVDTKNDIVTGKKNLTTPRDWIEWQANYFSSAIIMPRDTIMAAVIEKQQKMGFTKNIGQIILEPKGYSIKDYLEISEHLQHVFAVNATNVENRLNDLRILVDRRDMDVKHISELFTTE